MLGSCGSILTEGKEETEKIAEYSILPLRLSCCSVSCSRDTVKSNQLQPLSLSPFPEFGGMDAHFEAVLCLSLVLPASCPWQVSGGVKGNCEATRSQLQSTSRGPHPYHIPFLPFPEALIEKSVVEIFLSGTKNAAEQKDTATYCCCCCTWEDGGKYKPSPSSFPILLRLEKRAGGEAVVTLLHVRGFRAPCHPISLGGKE